MDIIELARERQKWLDTKLKNLGKGGGKRGYIRVLKMARRPDAEEYSKTVIITGLGMIFIGFLGFAIYLLWTYLPGALMRLLGLR